MANIIVLELDINCCSKCKTVALHSVTLIEGIDSLKIEMKGSTVTLTVTGSADPVCMCNLMRKKFKCARLVSYGPPPKPPPPPPPPKPKCVKCGKEFEPPKYCPECECKCKCAAKCKCQCKCKCEAKCKCKCDHPKKCKAECKCDTPKPPPPCEKKCKCDPPKPPQCEKKCKAECKCDPDPKPPCEKKCNPPPPTPTPTPTPTPCEETCRGKCNPPCSACLCILVRCCPRSCACSCRPVECYPPCSSCACSTGSQILWPRYHNPGAPDEVCYVWDEDKQPSCIIM